MGFNVDPVIDTEKRSIVYSLNEQAAAACARVSEYTPEDMQRIVDDFTHIYYNQLLTPEEMRTAAHNTTSWLGFPTEKTPTDVWVYQEIISAAKPSVIIETGTKFGGSAVMFDSFIEMLKYDGIVISVDINHDAVPDVVVDNPNIYLITGDSGSEETFKEVKELTESQFETTKNRNILIVLDSLHTYDHVKKELALYSTLVSKGCHLVVEDTTCAGLRAAIYEFVEENHDFKINISMERFMLTAAHHGFLLKVN